MLRHGRVIYGRMFHGRMIYGRMILGWWLVVAGLLMLTACPPAPAPTVSRPTPGQETQALLTLGRERLSQGQYREAGDAFRAALRAAPTPQMRYEAMLGGAVALEGQGQYQAALDSLAQLPPAGGLPPLMAAEAGLLRARLNGKLGHCDQAVPVIQSYLEKPPTPLPPVMRQEATWDLARCLSDLGRHSEAAALLLDLAAQGGPRGGMAAQRLSQTASFLPVEEIRTLRERATGDELHAALGLALARAQLGSGDLAGAQVTLAGLQHEPAAQTLAGEIRALEAEMAQAQAVNPRAVGAVLPLSGPYAGTGKAVLAAVELGLDLFRASGGAAPTLYIEDSRDDPRAAAAAVDRLVKERQVMAIIGPMGAQASLAAARQAQAARVSLLCLSQVSGVTQAGPFIFQNFFTPSEQVAALLDEVVGRRGMTRLAILAPENNYGRGFARLMIDQATARGALVVRTIYYAPNQNDYSAEVKKLVKLPPGNYRPGLPESPRPVIDFQALFLPDSPTRVGMLAPQLSFHDVVGIQLMGTSLWHDPALVETTGRYIQGAVFPDAFDPSSPRPVVQNFVSQFREAQGRVPNVLEAQGFDTALLLRRILDSATPPRTRSEMQRQLTEITGVEGVCGVLNMDAERRVERQLTLFMVRGDGFTALNPAAAPALAPGMEDSETGAQPTPGAEPGVAPGAPAPAPYDPTLPTESSTPEPEAKPVRPAVLPIYPQRSN
ncbi:MAG: penicillin-binding protein activator [Deltaproteobacteria bacterium]|nr:penicillin-binding protein activator [Deltaproteobacteria bacterium]